MKLIDLHKSWCMCGGELPRFGLCNSLSGTKYRQILEDLFEPDKENYKEVEGSWTYWASGLPENHPGRISKYTPLRQTIVLLICAMKNEI